VGVATRHLHPSCYGAKGTTLSGFDGNDNDNKQHEDNLKGVPLRVKSGVWGLWGVDGLRTVSTPFEAGLPTGFSTIGTMRATTGRGSYSTFLSRRSP
jgi:hypothetical protein